MATKVYLSGDKVVVDKLGFPPIVNIPVFNALAEFIAVVPHESEEVADYDKVSIIDVKEEIITTDDVTQIQDQFGTPIGDFDDVKLYLEGFITRFNLRIVEQSNELITGALTIKSGEILNAAFAGNPKKGTVTFATAFAGLNYSPSIIANTTANTTYAPAIESILAGSFVINMGTNNVGNLTDVRWIAISHGET